MARGLEEKLTTHKGNSFGSLSSLLGARLLLAFRMFVCCLCEALPARPYFVPMIHTYDPEDLKIASVPRRLFQINHNSPLPLPLHLGSSKLPTITLFLE